MASNKEHDLCFLLTGTTFEKRRQAQGRPAFAVLSVHFGCKWDLFFLKGSVYDFLEV